MLAGYDALAVADVLGLRMEGTGEAGFREESQQLIFDEPAEHRRAGRNEPFATLSPVAIEHAVAQGLPRPTLRRLAERLAGGDGAKAAAIEWTVVPKTTLERRVERLSSPESERTERVARLFVHARRALGSEDEARDFMLSPHPELDGRNLVEAARTDLATRRAEHVLNALEYGLVI